VGAVQHGATLPGVAGGPTGRHETSRD
jgi:hypothetical protein